jgi:hypothetical protein
MNNLLVAENLASRMLIEQRNSKPTVIVDWLELIRVFRIRAAHNSNLGVETGYYDRVISLFSLVPSFKCPESTSKSQLFLCPHAFRFTNRPTISAHTIWPTGRVIK